jgi:hypothetical protein
MMQPDILSLTCQNPREVGYGIECSPGDQIIFDKHEDNRPHYRNKCREYKREEVAGLTQGRIDRVLNATIRNQAALTGDGE